jgi:hypothetical protein
MPDSLLAALAMPLTLIISNYRILFTLSTNRCNLAGLATTKIQHCTNTCYCQRYCCRSADNRHSLSHNHLCLKEQHNNMRCTAESYMPILPFDQSIRTHYEGQRATARTRSSFSQQL